MKKSTFLVAAACAIFCASALFAAQNGEYYIEAEGEFGKELEELVAKHSKDGNVTVRVVRGAEDTSTRDGRKKRMINIGVDKGQDFNIARGEKLYLARCASCHGVKGEIKVGGKTRRLNEMTGQQINDAIIGYANNPDYGGDSRHIMRTYAVATNYRDLGDMIAYIKGGSAFIYSNQENRPISRKPTKQGTYIE